MTRSTFGKSRVRESRMLGSLGAKPNGLATRPRALVIGTHPAKPVSSGPQRFCRADQLTQDSAREIVPFAVGTR